uniref:Uncharacterized protein n=1 Tax=Pelodiscus sinensis TaxID=13735 RepID=K7EYY9_PELSI
MNADLPPPPPPHPHPLPTQFLLFKKGTNLTLTFTHSPFPPDFLLPFPQVTPLPSPAHLVAQHGHRAGSGHLLGPKPDGGDAGGQSQDEDLGHGAHGLGQQGEWVEALADAEALQPGAQAVEARAQQGSEAQAAGVQQPGGRQDERHVGHHVDHGEPVHVGVGDAVEAHEDAAQDAVLDPLEGVRQRVEAEHGQHG